MNGKFRNRDKIITKNIIHSKLLISRKEVHNVLEKESRSRRKEGRIIRGR
jgi:hypothetical protein